MDQAIDEYARVLEDQPHDWNTGNVLGDLLVRTGQTERAIARFLTVADTLIAEGFVLRANAVYKKILKLDGSHEVALLKAAEIAATQGLVVDSRSHYVRVAALRRARGDDDGAIAIEALSRSIGQPSPPTEVMNLAPPTGPIVAADVQTTSVVEAPAVEPKPAARSQEVDLSDELNRL